MKILKYLVIFLVLVSASFLAVGFFVPTVTYESTVLVNKPITHSFNVFNNPFYLDKWLPGLKSAKYVSGMPNQIGSTYEMTFEENGEEIIMHEELTGFEVNRLYAFTLTNEALITKVKITFEEVNGKTKITSVSNVRGTNLLYRSLFPFMKFVFEAKDQEAYDNLKDLIEGGNKDSSFLMELLRKMG